MLPPGKFKALVKYQATVTCSRCSTTEQSSSVIDIDTGLLREATFEEFSNCIERSLHEKLIEPPWGWSINGRTDYRCTTCMRDNR